MADIQLTADGSQAIQTLQKIQKSVDNLSGQFASFAKEATKSIDSVKKSSDSLIKTTESLKGALLGLGVAKIAGDFLNYAKEVKGASNATGIAVNTINDFAKAVGKAGGDTNRAVGDVIDFVAQLNEAKQGSASAQAELNKIGISLRDLSTLSNEDIFKKTLDGLNKMEDASARNALAVKYLGRNFKDIDVKEVSGAMGSGADNSAAIENAAAAMKNFTAIISAFKQGVISAISPLTQFFGSLSKDTISKIGNAAGNLGTLATAILGLSGFFKVLSTVVTVAAGAITAWLGSIVLAGPRLMTMIAMISMMVQGIKKIPYATGGAAKEMKDLLVSMGASTSDAIKGIAGAIESGKIEGKVKNIGGAWSTVGNIFQQVFIGISNVFTKFLVPIAGIISALYAVNEVIKIVFDVDILGDFFSWLRKIADVLLEIVGLHKFTKAGQEEIAAEKKKKEELEKQKIELQAVVDGQRAVALEAKKTLDTYRLQGAANERNLELANNLIGLSEAQASKVQKLADIETGYITETNNLKQKYIELQRAAVGGTDEEKAAFAAFGRVYQSTLDGITSEYNTQVKQVKELLKINEKLVIAENARKFGIEAATEAINRMASISNDIEKIGLTEYQKSIKDIEFGFKNAAKQAIRLEEIRLGRSLDANEMKAYFDAANKGMSDVINKTNEYHQASTSFNAGWKEAFNQYVDDATNAAKIAGDEFRAFTNSINSAIDNFVDTGKFSFKDFAKSVLADFAKIELKAATMNLLGSIGGAATGSGGMLSGLLGGLLGGAGSSSRGQSASKPMYVMDVSGGGSGGGIVGTAKQAMGGEGLLSKAWSGVKDLFGFGTPAVGSGANAPDNMDVGGGWSPAGAPSSGGGFMDTISNFGSGIMDSVSSIFSPSSAPSAPSSGGGFMDSIGSAVGSIFGGSSDSGGGFMDSIGSAVSDMFGGWFADGGKPPMGKASIVGEKGPELFMPSTAGTIIPNSALGGGGGGGGQSITNVTNNISALDAKSVAQLLAENKNMIFGIVEQARKGMPSRG